MVLSLLVAGVIVTASDTDPVTFCERVLYDAEQAVGKDPYPPNIARDRLSLACLWMNRNRERAMALLASVEGPSALESMAWDDRTKLVETWAGIDLDHAEAIVDRLKPESRQDEETALIKAMALVNPEKAAERLNRSKCYGQFQVIEAIVDQFVPNNLPIALRFVSKVKEADRELAITQVARKLAPTRLNDALALDRYLDGDFSRENFYFMVFEAIVDRDPEKALTLVDKLGRAKAYAFARIAGSFGPKDPARARELAAKVFAMIRSGDFVGLGFVFDAIQKLVAIDPEGTREIYEYLEKTPEAKIGAMDLVTAWIPFDLDRAQRIFVAHRKESVVYGCFGGSLSSGYADLLIALIKRDPNRAADLVMGGLDEKGMVFPMRFQESLDTADLPNLQRFYVLLGLPDFELMVKERRLGEEIKAKPNQAWPILQQMKVEECSELCAYAVDAAIRAKANGPLAARYLSVIEDQGDLAIGYARLAAAIYPGDSREGMRLFEIARKTLSGKYENGPRLTILAEKLVEALGPQWGRA